MKPEMYIKGFDVVQCILLHYKTHTIAQLSEKTGESRYMVQEICRGLEIFPLQAKLKTVFVKRQPESKINYEKLKKHNYGLANHPTVKQQLSSAVKIKKEIISAASGVANRKPVPFKRPPTTYSNIPSPYGIATQMLIEQNREELEEKRKRTISDKIDDDEQ